MNYLLLDISPIGPMIYLGVAMIIIALIVVVIIAVTVAVIIVIVKKNKNKKKLNEWKKEAETQKDESGSAWPD